MLQQSANERSVGELFADLSRDVSTLMRDEVRLAKTEMTQKVTDSMKNSAFIVIGGVVAFAGYLALQDAAVFALARVMPMWAASLIVGIVVVAVAAALIFKGLGSLKNQDMVPRRTVETIKEDAQWAKQQIK
jgi:hypothetical protein